MEFDVPVVLDMRDMWPDIFVDAVPRPVRPIARLLLEPLFRQTRYACSHATAIIGITDPFVAWGLTRGGRNRSALDRSFPLSHETILPDSSQLEEARKFWARQNVSPDDPLATICYFGNVNRQLDLSHIVEAARILHHRGIPVRFVLCGQGERLQEYRHAAAALPNILFPGWVNQAQMATLMSDSLAGLDPLPRRYDFLATINNKAIIYLSAGLPVISSPRTGILFDLLEHHRCGLSYDASDAMGLADIAAHLVSDASAHARMSANAVQLYRKQFSPEKILDSIVAYLSQIVSSAPAANATAEPSLVSFSRRFHLDENRT